MTRPEGAAELDVGGSRGLTKTSQPTANIFLVRAGRCAGVFQG
jgi:hypothetical protein